MSYDEQSWSQNPGTMEEAYQVATQLEAIDAYETPVSEISRPKPRVRQLDLENESSKSSKQSTELEDGARRLVELENEVHGLRANAQRQASYFPNPPNDSKVRQSVQDPRSRRTEGSSRDRGTASSTHEANEPTGRGMRYARPSGRGCFNCGEFGHFSRDCKKPRFSDPAFPAHGPQGPQSEIDYKKTSDKVPGKIQGLSSPTKIRREAYLEVQLGSRRVLASLDSGCEQSVVGRNLIKRLPLVPTEEKLSTADGTDIPLLGETTIEFWVSGLPTSCRVVVTDAITELILGIEWLQQNQCVWDFGSNSFVIKGHLGRLRCRRAKERVRRILVDTDVVIPGQHAASVTILLTKSSLGHEDRSWSLTQKIKDSDLVIGNTVYDRDQIRSCCQVWNISDLPKRLKKGSEIGWVELIQIIRTEESEVLTERSEKEQEQFEDGPLDLRQVRTVRLSETDRTDVGSPDSQDSEETTTESESHEGPNSGSRTFYIQEPYRRTSFKK